MIFSQNPFTIPVWPNGAKENNGIVLPEKIIEGGRLLNSHTAEMYVYLPDKKINTGTAIVREEDTPGKQCNMKVMILQSFLPEKALPE